VLLPEQYVRRFSSGRSFVFIEKGQNEKGSSGAS
jgi:hypothetical protein